MNQKKGPGKRKKGATAAVLCFVAAIAIVGTYTFKDYRESQQELARAEELAKEEMTEQSQTANTDDIINEEPDVIESEELDVAGDAAGENDNADNSTAEADDSAGQSDGTTSTSSSTTVKDINFESTDKLLWPISGSICMNYSMDKTVYFQTLDQYKYNPALIISGAEGDQVISSAPGIVKSIDVTAETGTTVNVDIGNGYELFYGQLKEVAVKTGDYVQAKTVLGYVSEPTKYYSVEGTNVYFEMRKDGQPVNPMEFLVE